MDEHKEIYNKSLVIILKKLFDSKIVSRDAREDLINAISESLPDFFKTIGFARRTSLPTEQIIEKLVREVKSEHIFHVLLKHCCRYLSYSIFLPDFNDEFEMKHSLWLSKIRENWIDFLSIKPELLTTMLAFYVNDKDYSKILISTFSRLPEDLKKQIKQFFKKL